MYNDFNLNSDHPLDKTIFIIDDLRISNNGQYSMTITIPMVSSLNLLCLVTGHSIGTST